MTKKIMLITGMLACGLMITEATAQPLICPFTDYFTVSASSSRYLIRDLHTDGNLKGIIKDSIHFNTSCQNNGSTGSGHAYLIIGDSSNLCYLTILDGPFENNPSVMSANCTGNLRYTGMDHESGSYGYTLKFV